MRRLITQDLSPFLSGSLRGNVVRTSCARMGKTLDKQSKSLSLSRFLLIYAYHQAYHLARLVSAIVSLRL